MNFVEKLESIKSGWINIAFLSPTVETVAKKRAEICSDCEFSVKSFWLSALGDKLEEIQGLKCDQCGCPISAKIRSIKEFCPLKKW